MNFINTIVRNGRIVICNLRRSEHVKFTLNSYSNRASIFLEWYFDLFLCFLSISQVLEATRFFNNNIKNLRNLSSDPLGEMKSFFLDLLDK